MTLTIRGTVVPGEPEVPLEGVQLCEGDGDTDDNCDFSDANGVVTIDVPFGQEISYTLRKETWASYLHTRIVPESGVDGSPGMFPDAWLAEQFGRIGSDYPERGRGTGHIAIQTDGDDLEGITFLDLVGATSTAYYEDEERNWNPDLTETTPEGRGGLVEISPGEYQVNLGGTGERCVPTVGWPGDGPGSVRTLVREGYRSIVVFACPPPLP